MTEINHKTVFVLDHTQYFGISSEKLIDLDFIKSKSSGPPLPPLSKSLWTCSVEASIEYCRIVWDLFPSGKLIRFIVSDTAAHIVNTWGNPTQNLTHVTNAMSMVGVPPRTSAQSTDFSVIHGLRAAIDALAEPSDYQKELIREMKTFTDDNIENRGRVICITSARDNKSMKSLEDIYQTVLMQHNSIANKQADFLPIDFCHLVIINMTPMNMESLVSNRELQTISPSLTSEIHSVCAADIPNKLTHLIMPHYDLASTTVTGIPMKEEQNANSSANYDVEIFHAKTSHTIIFGSELLLPTSLKEGSEYETVTLKWCTPRGCGATDLQPCLAQHRVTPVDVTSRPSSCLINFLLNGRSVLLEMPRKTGGKQISHLLSARGGEIFIHTLPLSRTSLEDPPSISEGVGGRVTDYRIADFGNFIQAHRLYPYKPTSDRQSDENLLKARTKLCRRSRYFPLTLSSSLIYNVRPYMDPLLSVINKDELSESEVNQCRQVIFQLLGMSSRQEQLPLPNMGHRLKGNKKEEQYKLLWSELELLLQNNSSSPGHRAILQCLRECRSKGPESIDKNEFDQTNKDLEIKDESSSSSSLKVNVIRATTDSPLSPPLVLDSHIKNRKFFSSTGNRTLFDIISASERNQIQKRIDFAGRLCTPIGQIAKLYPNLGTKEANVIREGTETNSNHNEKLLKSITTQIPNSINIINNHKSSLKKNSFDKTTADITTDIEIKTRAEVEKLKDYNTTSIPSNPSKRKTSTNDEKDSPKVKVRIKSKEFQKRKSLNDDEFIEKELNVKKRSTKSFDAEIQHADEKLLLSSSTSKNGSKSKKNIKDKDKDKDGDKKYSKSKHSSTSKSQI